MTPTEIDEVEEYIVELIRNMNPYETPSLNKYLILFTCLDNKNVEATLPFLSKGFKTSNKAHSALPTISYEIKEANCNIMNAEKYFFSSSPNEHQNLSLINLMYILTYYNNLKIIITIEESDIFTHSNIITIINSLVDNINSKKTSFVESIGFAVGKTSGKFTIENYTDELKKINKSDVRPETWDILSSIISQKILIQVNDKESEIDIIEAINNSAIKSFLTSPKVLTEFYKNGLKEQCFKYLKSELFEGPNSYEQRIQTLMRSLKSEIEIGDIFSHIEEERTERLKKLTENIPFQNVIEKASFLSKVGKKIVQFPIQGVIFIFTELEKTENDFYEKDKKEPYTSLNIINGDKIAFGENDILNQSLMGVFLSIFFNENTVFYNKKMIGLSKYLHIFLRIFENFPGANIREGEKSLITEFGRIITKTLINYFTDKLNESVENLTEKKNHWKIEAKKLLSLTKDVGSLQKRLKEMKSNKREPYLSNKIDPEEIFLFSSIFLFLSYKCYEVYKEVWKVNKKNKFMSDILLLCQGKDFKEYLSKYYKQNTLKVLKLAHEYFGEWCLKNKLCFFALKYFEAAKLFSKVIETCRLWLNKMFQMAVTENEFHKEDIEQSIEKLVNLGLIEEAREWCYKFSDYIDDNSFLLGILEDLAGYGRNYNNKILEEYEKLHFEEVFVIEEQNVKSLRILKEFESKEWLECIEEFSN